jgi:sugar (pentulose or hexulose) kinase
LTFPLSLFTFHFDFLMKQPVIAIFDVGKTNKKLFLFDEHYQIVLERSARFTETTDEDGFATENLESLARSVFDLLNEVVRNEAFDIRAINFTTYGASFVYIDAAGKPVAPLYNYLKPYNEALKQQFYNTYGGEQAFSSATASPVLGNLNSGMQLYRIKYEKPEVYARTRYALHLPQYMSYLLTQQPYSDITSIGCHTNLWDFNHNAYHQWVAAEGVEDKLAPIVPYDTIEEVNYAGQVYKVGIGLHDSSAALIPYLVSFHEPFVMISTGTWCITLNPFNQQPLTTEELQQDCLCYMSYKGDAIKASRLFAGYDHEQQVKRIAAHFGTDAVKYKSIGFNPATISRLQAAGKPAEITVTESIFAGRDLSQFADDEAAYHQLILDIVTQQYASTQLVLQGTGIKRIFVDGGFSKNAIYMNLLASVFRGIEVYAASMAQATSLGAALAIHHCWNRKALPKDLIELKYYSATQEVAI